MKLRNHISSKGMKKREKKLEVEQDFKFSKAILSDVIPPARPHILNLYRQVHQYAVRFARLEICTSH